MTTLRDDHAALTRDRVMRALADLLAEASPAAISMHQVAERAGVSDRTLYRHFPNKRALYDELVQWTTDEIERNFQPERMRSPADLAASVAPAFAQLETLRRPYQAVSALPEAAEAQAVQHAVRRRNVTRAMAPATRGLGRKEARAASAVAHLLSSSRALYFLRDVWGMSAEEAAAACQWAVAAVAEAAAGAAVAEAAAGAAGR